MSEPAPINLLFHRLEALQRSRKRPPLEQWHPEKTAHLDLHIDREGVWYHEGTRFQREALQHLLASVMRLEGERYFLVTPQVKFAIDVADVPFLATDFERREENRSEGSGCELLFTCNSGDYVIADAEHPLWMREGRPYLHVRDGLNARLTRAAYYRLAELAEPLVDSGALGVASCGQQFPLI